MTADELAELQALLVRAAIAESQRQAACAAGDTQRQQHIEAELRSLWQRYSELEAQVA